MAILWPKLQVFKKNDSNRREKKSHLKRNLLSGFRNNNNTLNFITI